MARLLVSFGAEIDARNNRGETALALAASAGKTDVAKALLGTGAYAFTEDADGWIPLDYVRRDGHQEAVDLFENLKKTVAI